VEWLPVATAIDRASSYGDADIERGVANHDGLRRMRG
jgi:hypothetical protein